MIKHERQRVTLTALFGNAQSFNPSVAVCLRCWWVQALEPSGCPTPWKGEGPETEVWASISDPSVECRETQLRRIFNAAHTVVKEESATDSQKVKIDFL